MQLYAILSNVGFGFYALPLGSFIGLVYGSHLNPCGLRNDDVFGGRISYEDCVKWLSAPAGAGKDGANLVAWATTSNRIEGNTLLATARTHVLLALQGSGRPTWLGKRRALQSLLTA